MMTEVNAPHASCTRRAAIRRVASAAACWAVPRASSECVADDKPMRSEMGLVIYDCNHRRRWIREQRPGFDLFHPMTFLKYCESLGAGGMQANLGVMTTPEIDELRGFAEENQMFIDAIIRVPTGSSELPRFEQEVKTARDVGVQAIRTTIIPGRRYERFKTLDEFREFERRGEKMLELAAPIVEQHRVRLAVENHKDQRIDERIALFKRLDSEFIGACVDTGNSFALLDGAYEPIEALAPYAFTVHLKDQALQRYDDGFLLGDIPLGQGSFDLKRMVNIIRHARPNVRFALELITRDPLKVPCLTQPYFATMPTLPATDLARTLSFAARHAVKDLQQVSSLRPDQKVRLEDSNVASSIAYARSSLGL